MWTFLGIPVVVLIALALLKLAIQGGSRPRRGGTSSASGGFGVVHFVGPYLLAFGGIGSIAGYLGWGWAGLKVGGLGGAALAVVVGLLNKALYDWVS